MSMAPYGKLLLASGLCTILLCSCSSAGRVAPAGTAPTVGRIQRHYADLSRRSWDGTSPRPLETVIWFPASTAEPEREWLLGPPEAPLFRLGKSMANAAPAGGGAKRPLIVLSHGTGGSAVMLAWLAEPLARAGYVVAAVNHHGNTAAESEPAPQGFVLWWERAADLTVLIDSLLDDPELGHRIDATRIGAAGFSLGGYTVLSIAGAITSIERWEEFCRSADRDSTCVPPPEFPALAQAFEGVRNDPAVAASLQRHGESFRDPRVRASFAIAPVATPLTDESLAAIQIPLHIVVGEADRITQAATNAARAASLAGAALSVLEGAGHYTFLAECTEAGKERLPALCVDQHTVDRRVVHEAVAQQAVFFFDSSLE